jgi:hypothetical protein
MKYPQQLIDRVSMPMPKDLSIVAGSTPVVSFGNPATSKVATLGINPSSSEFSYGKDQPLLSNKEKRLVDLEVLRISDSRPLTLEESEKVIDGCNSYFDSELHYEWFLKLEEIVLKPAGFTYYGRDASACHLDLVQWATDPVWSRIKSPAVRKKLLTDDKEFLRFQLSNYKFDYVYLNGGTVVEQFMALDIAELSVVHHVTRNSMGGTHKVFKGAANGTTYLGWGINAASNDANKLGLVELSQWIKTQESIK